MRKRNVSVYSDEDFPNVVFIIDENNDLTCAKQKTAKRLNNRSGYSFCLRGKRRIISERNVMSAIKNGSPLLTTRYTSRYESKNARLENVYRVISELSKSCPYIDTILLDDVLEYLRKLPTYRLPTSDKDIAAFCFRTFYYIKKRNKNRYNHVSEI